VFVELEPGLEGLLHVSELSDQKVGSPGHRQPGDHWMSRSFAWTPRRKIGLSLKAPWGHRSRNINAAPAEGGEAARVLRQAAKKKLRAAAWTITTPWEPARSNVIVRINDR